MRDNRTKVTASTLKQIKLLFEAGAKLKLIANAFGVSISTIQNAKRCNFNYTAYKEFVDGQFKRWKLSRTKSNTIVTPNLKSINAVSDARMDWVIDKLADIEIRLRTLELNNK